MNTISFLKGGKEYLYLLIFYLILPSPSLSASRPLKTLQVYHFVKERLFALDNSLYSNCAGPTDPQFPIITEAATNKRMSFINNRIKTTSYNDSVPNILHKRNTSKHQGPIIRGKVVDNNGNPLIGASVMAKGSKTATTTDAMGSFTLHMPEGSSIIVISFMGMETKEIGISDRTPTIVLKEIGQSLREIIVTTGYEKTSKRTFTGAISKISASELKVDGVADMSRMIEGKAAGVTVQNVTGTFGSAPKITVRGSSSILGDLKPLWVIDGVVQEDIINLNFSDLVSGNSATLLSSAVAGLNPNDIQSVEILKDASATSIYGSRALNGVVVITTKQGKKDSPLSITYTLDESVRAIPNYSQYNILNSQETMSILKEMEAKGLIDLPTVSTARNAGIYYILAKATNTYNPETGSYVLNNDPLSKNKFLKKYELANTDWFKILFRPRMTQNHSLSFSGGSSDNSFYASLGYYIDPGWTIADQVKQISANIKGTFFLNDKLSIALSTLASLRDQKVPGSYESQSDVVNGTTTRDFDINPFAYALSTNRTLRPYDQNGNLEYYKNNWAPMNIINELKNNYMNIDVRDIRFQLDMDYKIKPGLTYNFNGSIRHVVSERMHKILENSNVVGAYNAMDNTIIQENNSFLYRDPNRLTDPKTSVLPNGGLLRRFSNTLSSYNLRNSFSYKTRINQIHELETFFGTELRLVDRTENNFLAAGLQYQRGYTPFIDPRIIEKIISEGGSYYDLSLEKERTIGFFGKMGYTYNRRYTFSFTGRYDGSNSQGDSGSSRWLPTYTISGKWNLSEESFMANVKFISNCSFRGAYGLTATAGPATNSQAIYRSEISDRLVPETRENGIRITELQNKNLTWEKQFETNLGLDLGLFDNKISLTTDIYERKAFDLIDFVRSSGIGGEEIKIGNNANMNTKGLEIALSTKNIISDNFKWQSSINFSVYTQKITRLENKPSAFDLVTVNGGNVVGYPRNSLYSYKFTGLNTQGLPTFITNEKGDISAGGANFQDRDNITKYLKFEGPTEPNKSIGLNNSISYKNWSLDLFIVGSFGNVVRLYPTYSSQYTDLSVFTKDFTNRWLSPTDEKHTKIPVIADKQLNTINSDLAAAYNTYNFSDLRIVSGDFVRLKNISLSWEFPKDFKEKMGLSSFNLKATAVNPWLLYADKRLNGQDPEFRNTGGVAFPIVSQYTFSIKLTL